MKLFNTIAASVAVAVATAGVAHADVNSQLASLQAQVNQLQAQANNGGSSVGGMVGVNPALSWAMMGNMPGVGKELTLLKARQNGLNNPVTIGGYAQGDIVYQHTNTDGAFNAVPVQNGADLFNAANSTASNASRFALSNANVAITAAVGQWLTGYIQGGAQNVGSSANGNNDNLQVQDAYAVFGNLAKAPVYGFAGKKDIDFGSFATVDMYSAPLTREFFQASGNAAGLGVNAYGFNGTVSLMNGTTDVANRLRSTKNTSFGGNYAVNLGYGMNSNGVNWNVGAGYLRGSAFSNNSNGTNAAWDFNGKVSVAGFDFLAEYAMTAQDVDNSSRADAWDVGAGYNFPVMGYNSNVSAEYSQAKLGDGSDAKFKQFTLGYRIEPVKNVWTGLEYAYNKNGVASENVSQGVSVYGSGYKSSTFLWDVTAAF